MSQKRHRHQVTLPSGRGRDQVICQDPFQTTLIVRLHRPWARTDDTKCRHPSIDDIHSVGSWIMKHSVKAEENRVQYVVWILGTNLAVLENIEGNRCLCKEHDCIWLIYQGPVTCLTNLFAMDWGGRSFINLSHTKRWTWHIKPHVKGHSHNTHLVLMVPSPPDCLGDRMNGITAKCEGFF